MSDAADPLGAEGSGAAERAESADAASAPASSEAGSDMVTG